MAALIKRLQDIENCKDNSKSINCLQLAFQGMCVPQQNYFLMISLGTHELIIMPDYTSGCSG